MRFNKHLSLQGEHAFLSPSQHYWVNYTPERLTERWLTARAAAYGTAQHLYAQEEITAGRLSNMIGSLGQYINDAIHYKMIPEQILFYSENCFGTADAISFRYNTLRIFDLKTGIVPGSVHQLEIYAALFCLEYGLDPFQIKIELRIYQDGEISIFDADPEDIVFIMGKIQDFDKQINQIKLEEAS